MQIHRFYSDQLIEGELELVGAEAHHLSSVLRSDKGSLVEVIDGKGGVARAKVLIAKSRKVVLQVDQIERHDKPKRAQIVIATSCPKGDRLDELIVKCTEQGVDRISFVKFKRSVKQASNPKAAERWKRLAIAAAKQSKRLFLPEMDGPIALEESIRKLKTDYPEGDILFGSLEDGATSIMGKVPLERDTVVFIGPEGGMTDEEMGLLRENGGEAIRITDTVLRIETAAISASAILAAGRGLNNPKKQN
jgi:16S rRNA (uracil1498-N3)-methyltransferase